MAVFGIISRIILPAEQWLVENLSDEKWMPINKNTVTVDN